MTLIVAILVTAVAIIGGKMSSALHFDAASHTYSMGGNPVPGVTTVMHILSQYAGVPEAILKGAADRGSAVHKACELSLWDRLDRSKLMEELQPYIFAFDLFVKECGFIPSLIEHRVFHDKLKYAGTFDLMGSIVWKRKEITNALIDIKTTFKFMPSVGPQTAAYKEAYNSQNKADKIGKRFALRLKNNGSYELIELTDATDWNVFLSCLNIRNYLEKNQ